MQLKKIVAGMSLAILSGALLTGCGGSSSSDDKKVTPPTAEDKLADAKKVLKTNADIAYAAYSDSYDTAVALQTAIATFKATPNAANFEAAKKAWLVSREPYGQTEVYRFRLSPIDSTNYTDEDGPEGDINAWPLGEALIDYVTTGSDFGNVQVGVTAHQTGLASNGAINGTENPAVNIIQSNITIDAALIANTATASDEHDVIAGYHAIEFMLWGQDLNQNGSATSPRDATAGHRPLTDFTTDSNAARRFQYMEVVAAKLVNDLKGVRDAWAEGASYRTAFTGVTTQAQANKKIEEIMLGMGTLSEGELAGERMQIALASDSQEDEHSCFSDNTHRDVWLNAEGVSNSYYGKYAGYDSTQDGTDDKTARAVNGYGLDQYAKTYGTAALAVTLEGALSVTETGYKAIDTLAGQGKPFDNLIQDKNSTDAKAVRDTILALNAQSKAIQAVATDLGLGDVVDDEASGCDTTNPTSDAGC